MAPSKLSSRRAVAAHCEVSASAVAGWISKGWLSPTGPWTRAQANRAATRSRGGRRGITAEHGTTSRWRMGCGCDLCSRAHIDAQIVDRHDAAMQRWADLGPQLCETLAAGTPYQEALTELKVTAQAVTSHRRRDPAFSGRLDDALTAGRDPRLTHGTSLAWRQQCRCPECRDAHESSRQR